jgi:hypothetical protein
MRVLLGLVAVLSVAFAVVGVPLPPHYPIVSTTNTTYAVPLYLGVQVFTGSGASTWTLPLSYANGGSVINGEFIFVRNIGSATVTVGPTSPDTIHGGSVSVVATAAAQLVMNNGEWLILSTGTGLA